MNNVHSVTRLARKGMHTRIVAVESRVSPYRNSLQWFSQIVVKVPSLIDDGLPGIVHVRNQFYLKLQTWMKIWNLIPKLVRFSIDGTGIAIEVTPKNEIKQNCVGEVLLWESVSLINDGEKEPLESNGRITL